MKGSIDSIKCMFIDLLTGRVMGREQGDGGRESEGRDSHNKEETTE